MNRISVRVTATGLALGLIAPMALADAKDNKTAWGAAAAAAGIGAVLEASKDHPGNAAVLAAGAVLAYGQYDKARRAEREDRFAPYPVGYSDSRSDNDPYGYNSGYRGGPTWRANPGRTDRRGQYDRYSRGTREVFGVITGSTGTWDRKLRVALDNGEERTVEVPRDITVRRDNEPVSVHDLNSDEVVRVQIERYTDTGTLKARRVDVLGRYDRTGRFIPYGRNSYNRADRYDSRYDDPYYRDNRDNRGRNTDPYNDRNGGYYGETGRWSGRVTSIDSRLDLIRATIDGRTVLVFTDRADIRDRRGSLDLRDLNDGDSLLIEGRRDGDRIDATRVTVR